MKVRRRLGLGALIGFPLATYVGYPALVWAASILRPRPFVTDPTYGPPVTFVIAAHNEAALIGAKVRNILDLDYPPDRIDCIVACDGCDDGTAGEVRRAGNDRLQVIELPRQRGKLAAVRAAVPHARGEIIALTDANAMLEQHTHSATWSPRSPIPTVAVVAGAKAGVATALRRPIGATSDGFGRGKAPAVRFPAPTARCTPSAQRQ